MTINSSEIRNPERIRVGRGEEIGDRESRRGGVEFQGWNKGEIFGRGAGFDVWRERVSQPLAAIVYVVS